MPIYSYRCPQGHDFEKLVQKVNDDPQPCPRCGQGAEQVPAVPAKFQWGKSGGWA